MGEIEYAVHSVAALARAVSFFCFMLSLPFSVLMLNKGN